MRKKWFWLLPALAALALAFLLPHLILSIRQNKARSRVETLPVEDSYLESGDMSIVEKMQLLCSDEVQVLSIDVAYDISTVQSRFTRELDRLVSLGALNYTVSLPLDEELQTIRSVSPYLIVGSESSRLLRIYEISTDGLTAIMDTDTGTIYTLRFWNSTEYAMEKTYITLQLDDSARAASDTATELSGWSAYYGLELSELTFDDAELPDAEGNWNMVSCLLRDAAGETVGFALSNQYSPYTIAWRCIDAEVAQSLRSTLLERAESGDSSGNNAANMMQIRRSI